MKKIKKIEIKEIFKKAWLKCPEPVKYFLFAFLGAMVGYNSPRW